MNTLTDLEDDVCLIGDSEIFSTRECRFIDEKMLSIIHVFIGR